MDSVYPKDSPKKIHFAAYLTSTVNVKTDEAVKFNLVDINEGGGYSPSSGVFTCPKSGTYLLSWFFINDSKGSGEKWLRLDINGKSDRYGGLNIDERYNSAFRSHLVVLKKGDMVKVEAYSNMAVFGNGNKHTGFSGLYVSA